MRISDWGSDVCYSDLSADILRRTGASTIGADRPGLVCARLFTRFDADLVLPEIAEVVFVHHALPHSQRQVGKCQFPQNFRSEEHTSELQSLMRISYAVFCLKKKKIK